ncbi:hypothetical protein ACO1O0_001592 [Amphichorda felina]
MADTTEPSKITGDKMSDVVVVSAPGSTDGNKEESPATDTSDSADEKKDEKSGIDTVEESENEDEEEKKEEKAKVMVGSISESKDLYAKYDEQGNKSWSENPPDGLEEAAENEETQKYAVLVRKKKPKEGDSSRNLVIDSLIIQSPYLKRVLANVLDGYPGIVTKVSRLTFSAPFECFVHRWDAFTAAKDDPEHDDLTRQHVDLLYNIMKAELGDLIRLRQDYFENKVVAWEHAWMLFPPGCIVLGSRHGKPVAVRFDQGHYTKTQCGYVYAMGCEGVDWDGTIMGWTDIPQQVPQYLGVKPFNELPCYPIEYHVNPEAIKALLRARGRVFESFAGFHYKAYSGTALYHPEVNKDKTRMETVESRIVIDGANWEKCNPENVVYLSSITRYDKTPRSRRGSVDSNASNNSNDSDVDLVEDGKPAPLTEDQALMAGPIVRGYSLKNKRWMEFFIDSIHEITFDDRAFDSLVLPADQKDLILAFAQSQVKYKNVFDDIISGKGKGIIMLLSGGPGIGKTLTAESVAEEMRVPLYIMSAGDLGSKAHEVEENLGRILSMVANWNAVLLLDECDVFLEERTAHEMERNRIVGIFLRLLEYYEGCLFLTTNRVSSMDPAFQSRIHLSLEYPPLDGEARAAVWRGFLDRTVSRNGGAAGAAAHELTEEEVGLLSGLDLNGRQIKNVLKMSNLLACQKEEKLKYEHIRKVLKVEGHSL